MRSANVEFMCEFRRATVLFIKLDGLEIEQPGSLNRLNLVVNMIFRQLHHYEGTLRQLIIDDKGTVAILLFGLRPAHGNHTRIPSKRRTHLTEAHSRACPFLFCCLQVTTQSAVYKQR